MPLSHAEAEEFERIVTRDPEDRPVIKIVTSWEKTGWQEGRLEGARRLLLLVLERRFDALSDEVKNRVNAITAQEKRDALLVAVLKAKSLDDLPW